MGLGSSNVTTVAWVTAVAWVRSLARELSHAMGVAKKTLIIDSPLSIPLS